MKWTNGMAKGLMRMLRIALLLLAMLATICTLAGCARRGICESCHQEAKLTEYVTQNYDDHHSIYLCDDCLRYYKLLEML